MLLADGAYDTSADPARVYEAEELIDALLSLSAAGDENALPDLRVKVKKKVLG